VITAQAMRLELPKELRMVHPVFHVSLLEPHTSSDIPGRTQSPPPAVEIEDEEEWEVEEVLDSRVRRKKLQYLVRWTGFTDDTERQTWQTADEVGNASELVDEFHKTYPDKPGPELPPTLLPVRKSKRLR
jgi:hypothetical protein